MIYADTDFFLELLKESDWLQKPARALFETHKGDLFTSRACLVELLLLAVRPKLDPERLLTSAMKIAQLQDADANAYLLAAHYIKHKDVGVFDALHAAFCGRECQIISSDKVFDRLNLTRIPLDAD